MTPGAVLSVRSLSVVFPTSQGVVRAVDNVTFAVGRGRTLGVVGESGSGKSVSLRAVMSLVRPPGVVIGGEVWFGGRELLGLRRRQLVDVRGQGIGMIFQDPSSALDPVMTVGAQLCELLRSKVGLGRRAAQDRALDLLTRVEIAAPTRRLRAYPHELSGGMRQRVMIAMAVATEPDVLLADEPTTALDVTIQDQILALLADIQRDAGMAMILVSHDLDVVSQASDELAVMYRGKLVESGCTDDVLSSPRHPYTRALIQAVPRPELKEIRQRLSTIAGSTDGGPASSGGCTFAARCGWATLACQEAAMMLDRELPEHGTACIRGDDLPT